MKPLLARSHCLVLLLLSWQITNIACCLGDDIQPRATQAPPRVHQSTPPVLPRAVASPTERAPRAPIIPRAAMRPAQASVHSYPLDEATIVDITKRFAPNTTRAVPRNATTTTLPAADIMPRRNSRDDFANPSTEPIPRRNMR